MKNKFKRGSLLLLLLTVAFTATSCGKSKEEKEAEELAAYHEQEAKDIEAISDIHTPDVIYDETDGSIYDANILTFADHEVEYDTEFSAGAIEAAQKGLILAGIAGYQKVDHEELSKYFTDWACAIIEQNYRPTILETGEVVDTFTETVNELGLEPPQETVLKTFVRDDCIEVVIAEEFGTYEQYFVYFKNGKIDNIEGGEWFMDKEELIERYGDIFD